MYRKIFQAQYSQGLKGTRSDKIMLNADRIKKTAVIIKYEAD